MFKVVVFDKCPALKSRPELYFEVFQSCEPGLFSYIKVMFELIFGLNAEATSHSLVVSAWELNLSYIYFQNSPIQVTFIISQILLGEAV